MIICDALIRSVLPKLGCQAPLIHTKSGTIVLIKYTLVTSAR